MFWKRKKKPFELPNVDLRLLSFRHIRIVGRAEFEVALSSIRTHRRYIVPDLLLLQLHFGTIDPEKMIQHIMEFDDASIGQALDALIERGLQ